MRLIRAAKLREMNGQIGYNLDQYRSGNFNFLKIELANYIETEHEIDEVLLEKIDCDETDHKEVNNCKILYKAMNGLSRYLARDARIWVYLVHTDLLEYSRKRWPIPDEDEKAIKHVRNHFFVFGTRGFERDNAASRLWWMTALCNRVEDLTLDEALTCFLYMYDVRANIIERPTTSQNVAIFSAILKKLRDSFKGDKSIFERETFRSVMKELNLKGGTKLLDALEVTEVEKILEECI